MQEQGIPFYRFNPQLDEVIPSGETDLTKLINMLIKVYNNIHATIRMLLLLFYSADQGIYDEQAGARHVNVEGTCTTAAFSGRSKPEKN